MPKPTAKALPQCELTWLPEGFDETNTYENETMYYALYSNPTTEDVIVFVCRLLNDETQAEFITDQQAEHLLINGMEAEFFAASNDFDFSNLLWIDAHVGVVCTIDSSIGKSSILHIAEGAKLVNPTK